MTEPTALTDADHWQRAVHGDADSFGVLFDRHCGAIRSYCARRIGSLEGVDDLVSIVFLEAWRRRDDVELVDDLVLPWLYGIARLKAYQLYGLVGPDVDAVKIVLSNGTIVTATVHNGLWGAWWPADKGAASGTKLEVLSGTERRLVDPKTATPSQG